MNEHLEWMKQAPGFQWLLASFMFVFGACIGSFLNVVIYRLPRGLSLKKPRWSFCTTSGKTLPWYDNIPLLSFIWLRGRSRFDGQPISWRYPLVELLTALLFVWIWFRFWSLPFPQEKFAPFWMMAILYMVMAGGLVAASFIDLEHFIIPDSITKTGIVLGLALSGVFPGLHGTDQFAEAFMYGVLGATSGFFILKIIGFLGQIAFQKEAMGMGDMKLMAAVGAFLGTQAVIFSIVMASFAGSAVGLTLVLLKRTQFSNRIPFGPYLAFGTLFWMLGGDRLWFWYLSLLTREEPVLIMRVTVKMLEMLV